MVKQTHTVATDALATLGTIIDETAGRDAIHLAVEPSVAAVRLFPGQDVGFVEGGMGPCNKPVGIVDPFLKSTVSPGQHFWLLIYPRQITSLRHVWEHPSFPGAAQAAEALPPPERKLSQKEHSEAWIRSFADNVGLDYEEVMDGARAWIRDQKRNGYGVYISAPFLEGTSVPDKFWDHYETVVDEKVDEQHRGSFFTCSC